MVTQNAQADNQLYQEEVSLLWSSIQEVLLFWVLLKNILDKKLKEGEPTTGLTFSLVFGDARWQCQVGTLSRPITLSHCCHGTDGTAPSATRPVHALRDLRVTSRWNRVPLVFIIIGVHMSCGTDTWELKTIGSPFSCLCNRTKYTAEITINSTK